ncbi:hypothetical protein COCON_G00128600 [Conger conger]|uniref:Uncharacterized protein n=1 Tax=Conger conger TaxID=82655 RepID=A0A9Q1DDC9_CONCO|nr:hypothetical protein COCON_G00128600 [Conger conger]
MASCVIKPFLSSVRSGWSFSSSHQIRVLAMTEVVEPVLDFASSERSGRRNALPDVLGSPAGVSPSDLPLKLDGPAGVQSPTAEELPSPTDRPEGKDNGS